MNKRPNIKADVLVKHVLFLLIGLFLAVGFLAFSSAEIPNTERVESAEEYGFEVQTTAPFTQLANFTQLPPFPASNPDSRITPFLEGEAMQSIIDARDPPAPEILHEIESKRTLASKTFQNKDGSFTATFTSAARHYLDENNSWQDIDTNVYESEDEVYDYENVKNNYKTYYKKRPVDFFYRFVDDNGAWLEFRFVPFPEFGPLNYPEAAVQGNQVLYPGIYEGIDFRFRVTQKTIWPEWIVHDPAVAARLSELPIEVAFEGATPHAIDLDGDGATDQIDFNSHRDGNLAFRFPDPFMYERDNPYQENYGLHYQVTQQGGNSLIFSKILTKEGHDWFLEPSRRYPVAIDTTTDYSGQTIDGRIARTSAFSCPTSGGVVNTTAAILIQSQVDYDFDRGYFSFQTSGLADDAVVSDADFYTRVTTDADSDTDTVYSGKDCWGSSLTTADWDRCTTNDGTYSDGSGQKVVDIVNSNINLTSRTQFRVIAGSESCTGADLTYDVYSSADQGGSQACDGTTSSHTYPCLRVVYNRPPSTPTSESQETGSCSGSTISAGGWSTSSTVCVESTISDPDSDTVQICPEKDLLGTAFANTEDACGTLGSSGSERTYAFTGLADGNYHWQNRAKDSAGLASGWSCYSTCSSSTMDFGVDTTNPTTQITSPAASSSQSDTPITITVDDADATSGLSSCDYNVYSNGVNTKTNTARTCNSTFDVTNVQGTGDCRDAGTDLCVIWVRAIDTAGNEDYNSISVSPVYDSSDVNIVAPSSDGNHLKGTVGVSFNLQDQNSDTPLFVDLNYSSSATQGTGTVVIDDADTGATANLSCEDSNFANSTRCTYTWDTSAISDGNYYILLLVDDGDSTSSVDFNASDNDFLVDNNGPSVSILAPDANSQHTGTIAVDFNDVDPTVGLSTCEYRVLADTGGGYTEQVSWTSRTCDGNQSITVGAGNNCPFQGTAACKIEGRATDRLSNVSSTASRTYTISLNTTPTVTLISPENTDGNYVSGTVGVAFDVNDTTHNSVLVDLNYSTSPAQGTGTAIINDVNTDSATVVCEDSNFADTTRCTYTWDTSGLTDGNYLLLLYVDDNDELRDLNSFDASDYNFFVDNTAPTTTDNAPATFQASDFNISLDCTDSNGSGCSSIDYNIDNNGWVAATTTGYSWWDKTWPYRRTLTIDNSASSEPLLDFPILLDLNSGNIDYDLVRDSGQDLRITDGNNMLLAHEIEDWNESGSSKVWVRVPSIAAGSTSEILYLYYGNAFADDNQNATGVWDSNFVGVWHLSETSGAHQDSTSNNNDSIFISVTTQGIGTGRINGADEFVADADDVNFGNPASLQVTQYLVEVWHYNYEVADGANWQNILSKNWNQNSSFLIAHNASGELFVYSKNSGGTLGGGGTGTTLSADTWYYTAARYDGDDLNVYTDGVSDANFAAWAGSVLSTSGWRMGEADNSTDFNGLVDEVRISNGARSPDWVEAQYKSMASQMINFSPRQFAHDLNASIPITTDGNHVIQYRSTDRAGKQSSVSTTYGLLNVLPPDVNIVAPDSDGNMMLGTVGISFNAFAPDNEDLTVHLSYSTLAEGAGAFGTDLITSGLLQNHASIANLTCESANFSSPVNCVYTWDTTTVTDGNYYIDVNVSDASDNNTAKSSSNDFLIDNTGPSVSITSPAASSTQEDTPITVTVTDTDANAGLSSCDYNVYSNAVNTKGNTSRTCNSSFTVTNVNGTGDCRDQGTDKCQIWVSATDRVGNVSYSSVTVSPHYNFTIDANLVTPSADGNMMRGTVGISFDLQDRDDDEMHARIAYSSSQRAFTTDFNTDLNLNNHAVITNLWCEDVNWENSTNCVYTWDTSTASDGNYYIDINVWDMKNGAYKAGDSNVILTSANDFMVDNTAPSTSNDLNAEWQSADFNVALTCSDGSGAGCSAVRYRLNSGDWISISGTSTDINIITDGNHQLDYNSLDRVGNVETTVTIYPALDKTIPSTSFSGFDHNDWNTTASPSVSLSCSAGPSGCSYTAYRLDTDDSSSVSYGAWQTYSSAFTVSGDGNFALDYNSRSNSGVVEPVNTRYVLVDTQTPTTSSSGYTHDTWKTSAPSSVTLSCSDANGTADVSGCSTTQYRLDTDDSSAVSYGSWQTYSSAFTVSGDGNFAIDFNSTDAVSHVESTKTEYLVADTSKPSTSWDGNHNTWQNADANVHLTCSDANGSADVSGCSSTRYRLDSNSTSAVSYGAWQTYDSAAGIVFSSDGNYAIDFNSTDTAGNVGDVNTKYVLVDKTAPSTTDDLNTAWQASDFNVTLTCSDANADATISGCATTRYSLDGAVINTSGTYISSGLVAYWKLDDGNATNAVDAQGNDNNGTLTNFACTTLDCNSDSGWVSDGNINGAVAFDGTNDYITVPDADNLDVDAITVEAWVKTTATDSRGAVGKAGSFQLRAHESAGPTWYVYASAGLRGHGGGSVNDGNWHQLVGTYSAESNQRLYVDGSLVSSDAIATGPLEKTSSAVEIARAFGGGNLPGHIDEVRIYNRALSAEEIYHNYRVTRNDQDYNGETKIAIASDGNHQLDYNSIDIAGNTEATTTVYAALDKTNPATSFAAPDANSVQTATFQVDFTDSDATSGLSTCEYRVLAHSGGSYAEQVSWTSRTCDGNVSLTIGSGNNCPYQGTGACKIEGRATDNAGNVATAVSRTYTISLNTAPSVTLVAPENADGNWVSGTVGIAFDVNDTTHNTLTVDINISTSNSQGAGTVVLQDANTAAAAVACEDSNFADTTRCTYAWNTTSFSDGNYYVLVRVDDKDDVRDLNAFDASDYNFMVDNTAPTTTTDAPSGYQDAPFTVTLSCSDGNGSGCNSTSYRLDGASFITSTTVDINQDGNRSIDYFSVDRALKSEDTKNVVVQLADLTTTLLDVNTDPYVTDTDLNGIIWADYYNDQSTKLASLGDGRTTVAVHVVKPDGNTIDVNATYADANNRSEWVFGFSTEGTYTYDVNVTRGSDANGVTQKLKIIDDLNVDVNNLSSQYLFGSTLDLNGYIYLPTSVGGDVVTTSDINIFLYDDVNKALADSNTGESSNGAGYFQHNFTAPTVTEDVNYYFTIRARYGNVVTDYNTGLFLVRPSDANLSVILDANAEVNSPVRVQADYNSGGSALTSATVTLTVDSNAVTMDLNTDTNFYEANYTSTSLGTVNITVQAVQNGYQTKNVATSYQAIVHPVDLNITFPGAWGDLNKKIEITAEYKCNGSTFCGNNIITDGNLYLAIISNDTNVVNAWMDYNAAGANNYYKDYNFTSTGAFSVAVIADGNDYASLRDDQNFTVTYLDVNVSLGNLTGKFETLTSRPVNLQGHVKRVSDSANAVDTNVYATIGSNTRDTLTDSDGNFDFNIPAPGAEGVYKFKVYAEMPSSLTGNVDQNLTVVEATSTLTIASNVYQTGNVSDHTAKPTEEVTVVVDVTPSGTITDANVVLQFPTWTNSVTTTPTSRDINTVDTNTTAHTEFTFTVPDTEPTGDTNITVLVSFRHPDLNYATQSYILYNAVDRNHLTVAAKKAVTLDVNSNKTAYGNNEIADVNFSISPRYNSALTVTDQNLQLLDAAGSLLKTIYTNADDNSLPLNNRIFVDGNADFNTGVYQNGSYIVRLTVQYLDEDAVTRTTTFDQNITIGSVVVTVTTNKSSYSTSDNVYVSGSVSTSTTNSFTGHLEIRIKDIFGVVKASTDVNDVNFSLGSNYDYNELLNVSGSSGTFTVFVRFFDDANNLLDDANTSYNQGVMEVTIESMSSRGFGGAQIPVTVKVVSAEGRDDAFTDSNFSIYDQNNNIFTPLNFTNLTAGRYSFNLTMPSKNDDLVISIQVTEITTEDKNFFDIAQQTVTVSTHSFAMGFILDTNYGTFKLRVPGVVTSGTLSSNTSQDYNGNTDIDYISIAKDDNMFALVSGGAARDVNIIASGSDRNFYMRQTTFTDVNGIFYIVATKGDNTDLDQRMAEVRAKQFEKRIKPAFGYGDADKFTINVGLDFNSSGSSIDLNNDILLPAGTYGLVISNRGKTNGRHIIHIEQTTG